MPYDNIGWYHDDEKTDHDRLRAAERELEKMKKAIEMLITVGHLDREKYDHVIELIDKW